jgi:hypothetical protein
MGRQRDLTEAPVVVVPSQQGSRQWRHKQVGKAQRLIRPEEGVVPAFDAVISRLMLFRRDQQEKPDDH